jgi:outer membrane biosynthesis protein TonB
VSLFKKKQQSGFDEQEQQSAAKSSGSLIVLLILLAAFAYLYFFTSLIVPHEKPADVNAPTVVTEVKQSMPPKPADLATAPAPAPPATPAAKPAPATTPPPPAVKTTAPAPVAAKPAPPAATPKGQPAAKPAAPAVAPKAQTAVKPTPAPLPAASKTALAAVKKAETAPAKAGNSKSAAVAKKAGEAKSVKTPPPVAKKSAAIVKPETYTVFAGEFPAGDEASAAEAKLARLGIKPIIRKEIKKSIRMNRLFYGAYTDYDQYSAELEKLRQAAKNAFGVENNGTYSLYAGSFAARDRVEKEKKDLAAKGVTLQIQPTVIALATVKLTAGVFSSKQEADKAAVKMKGAGLAAKVVTQRR